MIYELTAAGDYTVLHSFGVGPDGYLPLGVVVDSVGNLYGTTADCGVVYEFDADFPGWRGRARRSRNPFAARGLYGNSGDGTEGGGIVFKLALP